MFSSTVSFTMSEDHCCGKPGLNTPFESRNWFCLTDQDEVRSPCAELSARRRKKRSGGRQWKKVWVLSLRKNKEERTTSQEAEKSEISTESGEDAVRSEMESSALGYTHAS